MVRTFAEKPYNIARQVLIDAVRISLQFLEREWRVVVEALTCRFVEKLVECVVIQLASLPLFMFGEHFVLGRGQDAVEAAQHRHR